MACFNQVYNLSTLHKADNKYDDDDYSNNSNNNNNNNPNNNLG